MKTKFIYLLVLSLSIIASCKKDNDDSDQNTTCKAYGMLNSTNLSDTIKYQFDSSERIIADGNRTYIYIGNEVNISDANSDKAPTKVVLNANGLPVRAICPNPFNSSGSEHLYTASYTAGGNLSGITCDYSFTVSTSQDVISIHDFMDNIVYDNNGNITSIRINREASINSGTPDTISYNVSFEYYLDKELTTPYDPTQKIYALTGYKDNYGDDGLTGYNNQYIQAFSKNLMKKSSSEDDNYRWGGINSYTYEFDANGNVITAAINTDNGVSQKRFVYQCK